MIGIPVGENQYSFSFSVNGKQDDTSFRTTLNLLRPFNVSLPNGFLVPIHPVPLPPTLSTTTDVPHRVYVTDTEHIRPYRGPNSTSTTLASLSTSDLSSCSPATPSYAIGNKCALFSIVVERFSICFRHWYICLLRRYRGLGCRDQKGILASQHQMPRANEKSQVRSLRRDAQRQLCPHYPMIVEKMIIVRLTLIQKIVDTLEHFHGHCRFQQTFPYICKLILNISSAARLLETLNRLTGKPSSSISRNPSNGCAESPQPGRRQGYYLLEPSER